MRTKSPQHQTVLMTNNRNDHGKDSSFPIATNGSPYYNTSYPNYHCNYVAQPPPDFKSQSKFNNFLKAGDNTKEFSKSNPVTQAQIQNTVTPSPIESAVPGVTSDQHKQLNYNYLFSAEGITSTRKRNHMTNKAATHQDPLSHRIIEKRRRDRLNNCLAELKRLIPTYYLKKSKGRIEKTEIIEMAIKYLKHLQAHACTQIETCEVTTQQERDGREIEQFHIGYQDCMSETLDFLRDSEGLFSGDSLCVRLMNHLTKHVEVIFKNRGYVRKGNSCSSSSSSGYHANGSSSNGSSSDGNGSTSNNGGDTKCFTPTETLNKSECKDASTFSATTGSMDSGLACKGETNSREALQHQPLSPQDSLQSCSDSYMTSSGLSSNNSSSGDDNAVRLYKFKSNMKHRFSVDLEHSVGKKQRKESSSSASFPNYINERGSPSVTIAAPATLCKTTRTIAAGEILQSHLEHHSYPINVNRNNDEMQGSIPRPPAPNTQSNKYNSGMTFEGSVPIFALNQNGTFYVPLNIDYSIIATAMSTLQEIPPVLHPVSIYVNFCSPYSSSQLELPHFKPQCQFRSFLDDTAHLGPMYAKRLNCNPSSSVPQQNESFQSRFSKHSSQESVRISTSQIEPIFTYNMIGKRDIQESERRENGDIRTSNHQLNGMTTSRNHGQKICNIPVRCTDQKDNKSLQPPVSSSSKVGGERSVLNQNSFNDQGKVGPSLWPHNTSSNFFIR